MNMRNKKVTLRRDRVKVPRQRKLADIVEISERILGEQQPDLSVNEFMDRLRQVVTEDEFEAAYNEIRRAMRQ